MARPMPFAAPVTTATLPVKPCAVVNLPRAVPSAARTARRLRSILSLVQNGSGAGDDAVVLEIVSLRENPALFADHGRQVV